MANLQELFQRHRRPLVTAALVAVAAAALYFGLRPDAAGSLAGDVNAQVWIDADGVAFNRTLRAFDDAPAVGPTGKPAFRAELCYWTKDGTPKAQGTPVLLGKHVGRPGPTFCPDCDRLVVELNPPPLADVPAAEQRRPPPTRAEHGASKPPSK